GVVFYALGDGYQASANSFARRDDCLTCHHSFSTIGIPGMLARSVNQFTVNHRLPFSLRWGGWYVTGQSGALRHLGNVEVNRLFVWPPRTDALNLASVVASLDTAGYLLNN